MIQILVESGTGTTALFLARHLQIPYTTKCLSDGSRRAQVSVIAIPCIGSGSYLQAQMERLDEISGNHRIFPTVLPTHPEDNRGNVSAAPLCPKRVFAKPYKEHLDIWRYLESRSSIRFDLVYAPRAWEILHHYWTTLPASCVGDGLGGRETDGLMYIHCGGAEGNESMLRRYRRAGLLE